MLFETVVDAIRVIRQRQGRSRKRLAELHVDKGYAFPKCRQVRIDRRGAESAVGASRRAPTGGAGQGRERSLSA